MAVIEIRMPASEVAELPESERYFKVGDDRYVVTAVEAE